MPLPGIDTLYLSRSSLPEGDTFCFDYQDEPTLQDASGTLSDPAVTAARESGTGTVSVGTPAVTAVVFKSTNGKEVPSGHGIKVRITPGDAGAQAVFVLSCSAVLAGDRKVRDFRLIVT